VEIKVRPGRKDKGKRRKGSKYRKFNKRGKIKPTRNLHEARTGKNWRKVAKESFKGRWDTEGVFGEGFREIGKKRWATGKGGVEEPSDRNRTGGKKGKFGGMGGDGKGKAPGGLMCL